MKIVGSGAPQVYDSASNAGASSIVVLKSSHSMSASNVGDGKSRSSRIGCLSLLAEKSRNRRRREYFLVFAGNGSWTYSFLIVSIAFK
jgi:hypothetical protein